MLGFGVEICVPTSRRPSTLAADGGASERKLHPISYHHYGTRHRSMMVRPRRGALRPGLRNFRGRGRPSGCGCKWAPGHVGEHQIASRARPRAVKRTKDERRRTKAVSLRPSSFVFLSILPVDCSQGRKCWPRSSLSVPSWRCCWAGSRAGWQVARTALLCSPHGYPLITLRLASL